MSEEEIKASGWDSITETFERIYPDQKDPLHFGTLIKWRLGGSDPLDGISIYDAGEYYHFVTYGLSELYEKECEDKEYSGYGFEFTLKLKKNPGIDDNELKCVAGILQTLARMTFENGEIFRTYEYIYTGQETGMDSKGISKITGFITIPDKQAGVIDTPNGQVEFVQLVGMTDKELKMLLNKKRSDVQELSEKLQIELTDYSRDHLI